MTNKTTSNAETVPKIIKRFVFDKLITQGYRKYSPVRRFSLIQILIVLSVAIIALYLGSSVGKESLSKTSARVLSVSDGDTVTVQYKDGTQERVRLIGLDTPETHHPTKPVGCFGVEAENFTRKNLENKEVTIEFDVERHDIYKRTLAYIYLGDLRFNDVLVQQGYAKVLNIEPNSRYASSFSKYEIEARNRHLGLWGHCLNES